MHRPARQRGTTVVATGAGQCAITSAEQRPRLNAAVSPARARDCTLSHGASGQQRSRLSHDTTQSASLLHSPPVPADTGLATHVPLAHAATSPGHSPHGVMFTWSGHTTRIAESLRTSLAATGLSAQPQRLHGSLSTSVQSLSLPHARLSSVRSIACAGSVARATTAMHAPWRHCATGCVGGPGGHAATSSCVQSRVSSCLVARSIAVVQGDPGQQRSARPHEITQSSSS